MDLPQTQWSRIRSLTDGERGVAWQEAWSHLSTVYEPAMVRYARGLLQRMGGVAVPAGEAEDVVQAFLADCLAKGWLGRADPEFGRFRAFIHVLLKRYVRDYVEKRRAQRRYPKDRAVASLDAFAEGGALPAQDSLDVSFQDEWIECTTRAAIDRVRTRSESNAAVLDVVVLQDVQDPYEIAERTGIAPDAVARRKHRALKMLAEEIWEQVKATVTDPADREDERRRLYPHLATYLDRKRAPSFFGDPAPPDSA